MLQKIWASHTVRFVLIALGTFGLMHWGLDGSRLAFMWFLLALALGALACCVCIPRVWVTYIAISVLSLALTCAGIEFYYYKTSYNDTKVREGQYAIVPDAAIGYAPRAQAATMPSKVTMNGEEVYNVTYTSGPDGWRVTPQHPDATRAVVFLGCSYTLGEGVNDAESYPWQVAQLLGDDCQVYNFGLSGYGPHQALAMLETGRFKDIFTKYKQVEVFFLTLPGHELRVGGFSSWDTHGPRYMREGGRAVRCGHFDEPLHEVWLGAQWQRLSTAFKQTQLCKQVIMQVLRFNHMGMLRQQSAVFLGMQEYVQQHYSNAHFTLLVYPSAASEVPLYQDEGVRTLSLLPAFPDWPNDDKYRIPHDRHPRPVAYAQLAVMVAEYIRGQAAPQAPGTQSDVQSAPVTAPTDGAPSGGDVAPEKAE